jgi:uncharacterized protein (DUF362 family)
LYPKEDIEKFAKYNDAIEFDLGSLSYFSEMGKQQYKIDDYYYKTVNEKHTETLRKYLIAKSVFDADLIISLPKPKTHRFAGLTRPEKFYRHIC